MDNQNLNNNGENNQDLNNNEINNSNINNSEVINQSINNSEENVVKPVVDKRDLADKTIDAVEDFMNTKDHQDEYSKDELKLYRTSSTISYIPLVSLYFVVTGKYRQSNYLKFHVNQGLNITILYAVVVFISKLLNSIFANKGLLLNNTPAAVSFVIYTLYFICFLLMLFGIINTVNNNSKELPVVGKIKLLK